MRQCVAIAFTLAAISTCLGQRKAEPESYPKRCVPKLVSSEPMQKSVHIRPNEKWRGSAVVSYEILDSGVVENAKVKKKSGVADADNAALKWVRGRRYNNRPGCGTIQTDETVIIDWR